MTKVEVHMATQTTPCLLQIIDGRLRSLQVRATNKQHLNVAHEFSVNLVHAYVATLTVAVLAVDIDLGDTQIYTGA